MNQEARQPIANPFGEVEEALTGAGMSIEQERAIQEVQAAMVIAKRFPRDPAKAMDRILQACSITTLAENASFAYPRGSETVTGPTIRLAEAIAQGWGNIHFGIMELAQSVGESSVMAFAWDLETNTKQLKTFVAKHTRYSRAKGNQLLTDPRDIYEMTANLGARRLRACILGVIPRHVTEAAEQQCMVTLKNAMGAADEEIAKMVEAFAEHGVTQEMVERRLGHRLESTILAEIISLRRIYVALRDGMAVVGDFFDTNGSAAQAGKGEKKTPADLAKVLKAIEGAESLDQLSELQDAVAKLKGKDSLTAKNAWEARQKELGAKEGMPG